MSSVFRNYAAQTRRPLASLLFVLPLLLIYEWGVVLMPAATRNGAEVWLRQSLDLAGLGGYFLLPVLTLAALLGWHHTTRQPWKLSPYVLVGMIAESCLLAGSLLIFAHLHSEILHHTASSSPWLQVAAGGAGRAGWFAHTISYCGAGIYEEVLFRLLLYPLAYLLLVPCLAHNMTRCCMAILLSSCVFSAAHYVGAGGDFWAWDTFLFRLSAGVFFAGLLVYRGFGIAAGTHAVYDVLAALDSP